MFQKYNFDKVTDRHGTNAVKVDALESLYGHSDLIPLWVADMDFETPSFIVDKLKKRINHPIFGYSSEPSDYWPSVIRWLKERHGWQVSSEWLTYIPGIVTGIGLVINIFTEKKDKVIIQPPVYHPFRLVPEANKREVVYNPLKLIRSRYEMDFDQLQKVITGCKIFILCNPHNPGGMTWDKETLTRLSDICYQNKVLVISDEIHADMALYGNRHIPFATVSECAAKNSITFGAPSKTFNIAGIISSYAIVPDEILRTKFYSWLSGNGLNHPNLFATIATEAAYTYGKSWLEQMLNYLEGNIDFVDEYMQNHIPSIKVMKPQASFLIWLDCRELNLSHRKLIDLFVKDAGLALNDGAIFGPGGEGFMRMNIGTPKGILEKALKQLKNAINKLASR